MISRASWIVLAIVMAAGPGCRKNADRPPPPHVLAPIVPPALEPTSGAESTIDSSTIQNGKVRVPPGNLVLRSPDDERIELENGAFVPVQHVNGVPYIEAVAIIDDAAFAQFAALDSEASRGAGASADREYQLRLDARLRKTAHTLESQIGPLENLRFAPRLGYFSMRIKLAAYQQLAQVKNLANDLLINPIVHTLEQDKSLRRMDRQLADEILTNRLNNENYSGLVRMGVPEFLDSVSTELGQTPSGSRVKIGITDTGVTYAHPSFTDDAGSTRIVYMRDFTGEGRLYFSPEANFSVSEASANEIPEGIDPEALLIVEAQAVRPVAGAVTQPVADNFTDIKTPILVSKELKEDLLSSGVAARFAITTELAFKLDAERVDLNRNGKDDDAIYAIVVQRDEDTVVYVTVLNGAEIPDFRLSPKLRNFNDRRDTMNLGAERFGFDLAAHRLAKADGSQTIVLGASIVGFDPGNHGTHVSGIAAGRKTIANDVSTTLARGVAPQAPLMVNRVCANNGGCNGSDALIDLAQNGAEIINMSLGGLSPFNDGYSVQDVLIDRVTQVYGALFVISAGNSGPGFNTVGSPSVAREALSVGAAASRALLERQYQWPGTGQLKPSSPLTTEEDFMLFFSSRGPTAAGGFKPEIVAPGTELSAIQLNSAPGLNAGLDVYWGTSMAAPAATGAIALLLDAAKIYNEQHPDHQLPIDARTLKRIVISSAKPFDSFRFDPASGELTRGQYTWIDQGLGMINLPRAWEALKKEASSRLPSALKQADPSIVPDVALDYQIRVLRTGPNGITYDGTLPLPPDQLAVSGPRFGRGIWLDPNAQDSLIQVQVARRLPQGLERRRDFEKLTTLLVATQDRFTLRTVFFGSTTPWLKAGTLSQLDCVNAPTAELNLLGLGAIDNFDAPEGEPKSTARRESLLNVCIDRPMLSALPPGDHGALIFAYRTDGRRTETTPSFIVPIYVTNPQKTLAAGAGYEIEGQTEAFGVSRHYVSVPEGTSVVNVSLEVPEALVQGSTVKGCASVRLYAYEGEPTATPSDLAGELSIASNCDSSGRPTPDKRRISFSRTKPKPGIWNLHVFGSYEFINSPFRLSVAFAKVESSVQEIKGNSSALTGAFSFAVRDASFDAKPSALRSSFLLGGFLQTARTQIANGQQLKVSDAEGHVLRSYDPSVTSVEITTGGSSGNDLDLYVEECNEQGENCKAIGQSGGSTDVESVTFAPLSDKRYIATVVGYQIEQGDGKFDFSETRRLNTGENGVLEIEDADDKIWTIRHNFDRANSQMLSSPLFISGKFKVVGDITLKTAAGSTMTRLPVEIHHQDQH